MSGKLYVIFIYFNVLTFSVSAFASERITKKQTESVVEFKVEGVYDDVRDDVEFAITGIGIRINTIAHTSEMLKRTGKDLGTTTQIFNNAEAFEFCSATVSRLTMEADPGNFIFCPYIIYVYQIANDSKYVYVSYRRPSYGTNQKSNNALKKVEKLLTDIILSAVE